MARTLAQGIEDLKQYIQTLEQALERANIGAESYRDFTREFFVTPEERAQVHYRRSRHVDRLIEARLRDGRLSYDPRKDPAWVDGRYIPPRPATTAAAITPALR